MILLGNIFLALAKIVELADGLLGLYKYILLASVIISWVNPDPYNPIVNFIHRLTEPVLRRVRRYLPNTGMIDLSPVVVFLLIQIAQIIIFKTAYEYLMLLSGQMRGQAL